MADKRNITNSGIYDLIDSMRTRQDGLRLEIKQDIASNSAATFQAIGRLERKFDELEAGRLTRAEGNINDLRVQMIKTADKQKENQAVISTKVAILWTIGLALILTVLNIVVTRAVVK